MSDRRLTPMNDRVAAAHLPDAPAGLGRVTGKPAMVSCPVLDLRRHPDGPRERQLLFGDRVTVYETRDGWSFVQADKDAYVGYVAATALAEDSSPSHRVIAASTHVYAAPDIKSPDLLALSFASRVTALSEEGRFIRIAEGYVPKVHVAPCAERMADPVSVAELFRNTPYLWGGNSRWGIDCSGLVQAALLACGRDCPGDSDLQERALGRALPAGSEPRRGDLLFWKGHVAWVSDPETILHANAHHMAVRFEPLQPAVARIEAQGDGPVTSHRRL